MGIETESGNGMSMTLYTFSSQQHYEDYVFKLYYPTYRRWVTQPDGTVQQFDIEKPLGYLLNVANVLETDFEAIKALVRERFKVTVSGCPLCFWNGGKFCWLKPFFIPKEKLPHYAADKALTNYVKERLAVCVCKVFDIDFISHRSSRGGRQINWDLVNNHFRNFHINWKEWLKRLESGEILNDGGNGGYLKGAPMKDSQQLEPVF